MEGTITLTLPKFPENLMKYKEIWAVVRQTLQNVVFIILLFLPPATKLGQGYVFTRVCDSVHRGSLTHCMLGYTRPPPRPKASTRPHAPGTRHHPPPSQHSACLEIQATAGGTHPTRMQSCWAKSSQLSGLRRIPFCPRKLEIHH